MPGVRDDVHRRAPVGPHWRSVIKQCANAATWEHRAPGAARNALIAELRRGLSHEFVALVVRMASARQPTFIDVDSLREAASSSFEHTVVDYLTLVGRRPLRQEHVRTAVEGALRATQEAHVREIHGHIALRAPRECAAFMHRLRVVLEGADVRSLAESVTSGTVPSRDRMRQNKLNLNEDLR